MRFSRRVFGFSALTLMAIVGPRSQEADGATLLADYNSSLGVHTTGGLVDSWESQVGGPGARDATPANGEVGRAPLLEPNIFFGGQPGLRFDGMNDLLYLSDAGFASGTSDYTLVVAFKAITLQQDGGMGFSRPTMFSYGANTLFSEAANALRPLGTNTPAADTTGQLISRTFGNDPNSLLGIDLATNYVAMIQRTNGATTGDITFDLLTPTGLQSANASVVGGTQSIVLDRGRIGDFYNVEAPDYGESRFFGWIGRVQVYDGALSAGERTQLINAMQDYVAIPVLPPGDVNFDGVVNIFDINLVSSHWGETGPVADANGDMIINIFDINLISANWTPSGGAVVPEPSTFLLQALGTVLVSIRLVSRRIAHCRGTHD